MTPAPPRPKPCSCGVVTRSPAPITWIYCPRCRVDDSDRGQTVCRQCGYADIERRTGPRYGRRNGHD